MRDEVDKRSPGQACFFDLQKAFGTLAHGILLTVPHEMYVTVNG